jgi:myo-inositol-1(or 4)-monophosphatase
MDIEKSVSIARNAAAVASRLIKDRVGDTSRFTKSENDLLDYATDTDYECERRIRKILSSTSISVFGEERGGNDPSIGWSWIVDPIDGTKNWASGSPLCAVSIGLTFNGLPVAGVVDLPLLDEHYWGIVGSGAWCDGNPISVNDVPLREAIIAYDMGANVNTQIVGSIRSDIGRIRMLGTTATELAWCAAGRFAAVVSPNTHSWDVAAGMALVAAAGGICRGFDGSEARVVDPDLVSGAPGVVSAILDIITPKELDQSIM